MEVSMEAPVNYSYMVSMLAKPGHAIVEELTADKAHALHMAVGISGEAGELLDAIKKHVIYGKPMDWVNVVEELGDLEFYMEGLRQLVGVTRDEVLRVNTAKLGKRYSAGTYSNTAAIAREDKADVRI